MLTLGNTTFKGVVYVNNYNLITYLAMSFFLYGFLGWVIENLFSYFAKGHFQEDGFLRGPFKPMYAIAMTILIFFAEVMKVNFFILLILCFIVPTVVEYVTGYIIRRYLHKDYWDYSTLNYNYQGLICLSFSVAWTVLTFIGVKYFQPYIVTPMFDIIAPISYLAVTLLTLVVILDIGSTFIKELNLQKVR